ncbi:hypothetical protein Bca52824_067322 [Brassica carinata]|uniref:Uncharacterized protein n=1 Tax=Brassica carinata TaxID=52824 RepID=A0A8X7QM94_BRACI|nr:hypothetical protein Bca52824_067322 [Brassica carinata]
MKCSLWVLYGLPLVQKDSILVTTSNGVGLVIEAIYLVVFFIYCDKDLRMEETGACLTIEIGLLVFFYGHTLLFLENVSARRKLIGVVCTVYTIIMHGLLALQTEVDGEQFRCMYLPFWFSFVNFINAGIWIAYSVIYKIDVYVLVVNVVGALACAIHLIILCCSAVRCLLLPKRIVPSSSVPVRNSSQCEQPRRKEANDAHTLTKRDSILVTTSNGVGLVIEAIYLVVFLSTVTKIYVWRKLGHVLQLRLQTEVDGEQFRCMYLPFWFSFVNFINAGIWIAYSVIYKIDVYVLVVNVVGALACAIHLIILCCSAVRCLLLPKRIVPSSSVPVRNSSQCEQPRRKEANDAHTLTKRVSSVHRAASSL